MKIPTLMLAAAALGLSGCATYAPPPGGPYAGPARISTATKAVYDLVRSEVPVADNDRAFYADMGSVIDQVRSGKINDLVAHHLN